jgi:hypothetical protein
MIHLTSSYKQMSSIERYHQRLESMLFKVTFQEKIRHVEQRLDAVFTASKSVKNASSFTDLLTVNISLTATDSVLCTKFNSNIADFDIG